MWFLPHLPKHPVLESWGTTGEAYLLWDHHAEGDMRGSCGWQFPLSHLPSSSRLPDMCVKPGQSLQKTLPASGLPPGDLCNATWNSKITQPNCQISWAKKLGDRIKWLLFLPTKFRFVWFTAVENWNAIQCIFKLHRNRDYIPQQT